MSASITKMSFRPYFEHDNRGPSTSKPNYRNNDFVMGRHKDKKYRNSGFPGGKPRILDLDGDVDMNAAPMDRRFNPYSQKMHNNKRNKKKSGKSKHERGNRHNDEFETYTWYKISIPHGRKLGKTFILRSITSLSKVPITPYNFQFNKNCAEFYVNQFSIAAAIREVNRRITTPDGFKMTVLVSGCSAPVPCIDPEILEIIKNCMSPCYDPERHSLNLMKFHHVSEFKVQGLYLPLSRSVVFSAVVKVIKENIPEIEILLLNDNKLYTLEAAASLVDICKQLRSINLQGNRLRSINELNYLKGLDVEELILDGNPLCDEFKDKSSYISAVRERFPKLMRLDGHELPAPIGFELGTETLPVSKKSFFAEEVKDLVIQFLDLYYSIYDSGDRSRLLDAYHDQASFSLSLSKNIPKHISNNLSAYMAESRNLLRVYDSNERFKLLKQGKLSVVNLLQELPQTMHDPSSFSVDIFHVSPGLMSFSVLGVFKEVGAEINSVALKTFSRTFVVVPLNQGFVIINEMLFIAQASADQQDKAFKLPAPTPSPSPAPPTDEKSAGEKQLLVMELSNKTGMNIGFSTKCLEENDWDYQKSLAVFMKFQMEGKLPPEAFLPG